MKKSFERRSTVHFVTSRIWMPFYYDGACAEHLRALGFSHVIHEQEDFFVKVSLHVGIRRPER